MKKIISCVFFFCTIGFAGFSQAIDFSCKLDSTLQDNKYQYFIKVNFKTIPSNGVLSLFVFGSDHNYKLLEQKSAIEKENIFIVNDRHKWMVTVEAGDQSKSKILK